MESEILSNDSSVLNKTQSKTQNNTSTKINKNIISEEEVHNINALSAHVAIIGLGYVGLPLAVALAEHFPVLGFDINAERIQELQQGQDRTGEIEKEILQQSSLRSSASMQDLEAFVAEATKHKQQHKKEANNDADNPQQSNHNMIFIVTVPTPVTKDNLPDLTPLQKASETVAKVLNKGSIVVYESTVYPGVTEEFCGPILEKLSGLKAGEDFYLGYSPERINPGDKEHTLKQITKVVAGQTKIVAKKLELLYGKINGGNIFRAKDIKTAEAAKVIENAQRDINIAFVNEIATIVGKLGLSIYDVLAAAETKWNFLKFKPGLVGGHCIGVDPYYLAHCARSLRHEPEVILSGRRINEGMGQFVAESVHQELIKLNKGTKANILILGLTFKEDIPDLRNTKVIDVIKRLRELSHQVDVHDPMADPLEAKAHLDIELLTSFSETKSYDCVLGAVAHKAYLSFTPACFKKLLKPQGLLADLKNMWRQQMLLLSKEFPAEITYWTL